MTMYEVLIDLPEGQGTMSQNIAAPNPDEARRQARRMIEGFNPALSATLYAKAKKAIVWEIIGTQRVRSV